MSDRVKVLFGTYPAVTHAISWVELLLCERGEGEDESTWDLMMTVTPPLTPADVVDLIRQQLARAVQEGDQGRTAEALAETSHPQFLAYIAGKMGAL